MIRIGLIHEILDEIIVKSLDRLISSSQKFEWQNQLSDTLVTNISWFPDWTEWQNYDKIIIRDEKVHLSNHNKN